jgi:hypothetical protein
MGSTGKCKLLSALLSSIGLSFNYFIFNTIKYLNISDPEGVEKYSYLNYHVHQNAEHYISILCHLFWGTHCQIRRFIELTQHCSSTFGLHSNISAFWNHFCIYLIFIWFFGPNSSSFLWNLCPRM